MSRVRRAAVVFVALAATAALTGSGTGPEAAAASAGIELQIAKNQRHVVAFGKVSGARPGDRLVATLLRSPDGAAGSYRRADRKRIDFGPRTRRERGFTARLSRPEDGFCRVRVLHRRAGNVRARAVQTFTCRVPTFELGGATLTSSDGSRTIEVFLAETPEQRSYGLSFRRRLASERGMAFLYSSDTSGAFWMKDTLIPLSIAFYDADGVILRILDMEPCPGDPCPVYDPEVTYRGALEVNHGAFDRWGIEEGDRVTITSGSALDRR